QLEEDAKKKATTYQTRSTDLALITKTVEILEKQKNEKKGFYEGLYQNLLSKIQKEGFEDEKSLKISILDSTTEKSYQDEKEFLENVYQEKTTILDSKKLELTAIQTTELPEMKEIKEQIAFWENNLSQKHKELGQIEEQIHQNELFVVKYQEKQNEIEEKKEHFSYLEKLNKVVGSADGKVFVKFAQEFTLENLVRLANKHLQQFNKRYLIKTTQKDLGLDILDKDQAEIRRPTESLSGGERFLVSLALALGLSDLASKNIRIKTLFIDEGFGSLDQHTLETALEALDNLQNTGKSIGIISHVELIKERIKLQIRVEKRGGGRSHLLLPQ
ncbi:MAG: SbcC/MukB-like Walker B domain-containing protein, partial [Thermonemataceae bacterium]|nr:SbcC/MukB-like Walker B domain-containing protein [Thermonemataceae bacterium]